jgi:hypothetical protein
MGIMYYIGDLGDVGFYQLNDLRDCHKKMKVEYDIKSDNKQDNLAFNVSNYEHITRLLDLTDKAVRSAPTCWAAKRLKTEKYGGGAVEVARRCGSVAAQAVQEIKGTC